MYQKYNIMSIITTEIWRFTPPQYRFIVLFTYLSHFFYKKCAITTKIVLWHSTYILIIIQNNTDTHLQGLYYRQPSQPLLAAYTLNPLFAILLSVCVSLLIPPLEYVRPEYTVCVFFISGSDVSCLLTS